MPDLGRCTQCKGKLLTKGNRVCCGQCGLPVPNHPLAVKEQAAAASAPTPALAFAPPAEPVLAKATAVVPHPPRKR